MKTITLTQHDFKLLVKTLDFAIQEAVEALDGDHAERMNDLKETILKGVV